MIPALMAVLLGFTPSRTQEPAFLRVCATSDTSVTSSTVEGTATGLSWTPAPNAIYRINADIVHTAAATTTGMQGRLDPGNATTGTCQAFGRSTATAMVFYAGSVGTAINTNDVLGVSTATTFTRLQYECVLQTTSSPTAVSFKFHTEVDTSAVTVKADLSCLHIERIR